MAATHPFSRAGKVALVTGAASCVNGHLMMVDGGLTVAL